MTKSIEDLLYFTEHAVSPFHTALTVEQKLEQEGFVLLSPGEEWKLEPGGKYMVIYYGTAVFAFTVGREVKPGDGVRMAAAHGDFPGFRVKPGAEVVTGGYLRLNVETYGGAILMSWLDRPLSLAGRVALRSGDVFHPETVLLDLKKPLLTIPNIAIHMEREINKGMELNRQTHMLPVLTAAEGAGEKEGFLKKILAEELERKPEEILDYELNVYNTEKGCLTGYREELLSAPRLDNLTSVSALTDAIRGERSRGINLMAVFDHEEVGSHTKQGAASAILPRLLEKIYRSLGFEERQLFDAWGESFLMSVDVSHAFHPAHEGKSDPVSRNVPGRGFAIKEAAAQTYATDSSAVAVVQQICEKERIPFQKYVNRSDLPGGSTLGSIASAGFPVKTVDLGVPILAMHSARELMGAADQESLCRYLRAYYTL